jgi:hypothetical protein
MKWLQIYLAGYAILLLGGLWALSKLGVLDRIGTEWTVIGIVIAVGIGIMVAVSGSGDKESIEIEQKPRKS